MTVQILIYASMDGKFKAVVEDIAERHTKGQPVLVGTVAIETSEIISNYLTKKGIRHNVLNAKNHEREAEIIANAGQKGCCYDCDEYGWSWYGY